MASGVTMSGSLEDQVKALAGLDTAKDDLVAAQDKVPGQLNIALMFIPCTVRM